MKMVELEIGNSMQESHISIIKIPQFCNKWLKSKWHSTVFKILRVESILLTFGAILLQNKLYLCCT